MDELKTLIVIPARGGSKGIPRKNLRSLNCKPLISYSIQHCLRLKANVDVVVSSEDSEILLIAEKFGAKIIKRPSTLSKDQTTLDSVIFDSYEQCTKIFDQHYDLVATVQPTSPLLSSYTIENALKRFEDEPELDTLITVEENNHLEWVLSENGEIIPNYKKRVNRQYLPIKYKETGGFLITRSKYVSESNRIGENVDVVVLTGAEKIDIDTNEDWALCEYYLKRRKITLVVKGYKEIGLGHVYNLLNIANDLMPHELIFVITRESDKAVDVISSYNFKYVIQSEEDLIETIHSTNPDVVINDILDTDKKYIERLKQFCDVVINFEDLGSGAEYVDLLINAIYPEKSPSINHYYGHKYFCLRSEFLDEKEYFEFNDKVDSIIITFGGVDPNNFTKKVLDTISDYCKDNSIKITVVLGLGYENFNTIKKYYSEPHIEILDKVKDISRYMKRSDLAFTSAGRTAFELASVGVPSIVLCQNERELTHFFADSKYGFINLGLGNKVSNERLMIEFNNVCNSVDKRKYMSNLMLSFDIKNGKQRVLDLIKNKIVK